MHSQKRAAFSPDNKYFACFSTDGKLLIWETENNAFIDCKFDSSTCTSVHWLSLRYKHPLPKKAKLIRSRCLENQLFAVGTIEGDILLYNVTSKNLYLHLVGRHSDAVNDMYFHSETDSFFTCSSDKTIAIWDITTGKQKSKWQAGNDPVSSICVIDNDNMLSSSTSIIWWNIPEKSVLKKFIGHSAEIFKLLPVNAVSLNSCYFLSAAVSDVKINAWSLSSSSSETPVASFVFSNQLEDMDISKASSKDKPLILSAVTKDGVLHLFEHSLNGNVNQPIHPKVSIEITPKLVSPSVISVKLSPDSESCIIAFGSTRDNMTFKHIKIKDSHKENLPKKALNNKSEDISTAKETSQSGKSLPINGLKSSPKSSENGPKKVCIDSVVNSYRRKLRSSSTNISTLTNSETLNLYEREDPRGVHRNRSHVKDINTKDPKSIIELLLKGIQTQNEDTIDTVLHISDSELIRICVESLPLDNLKFILEELNSRLRERYTPILNKWLKEILKVHLKYLTQSEDTAEVLHCIKECIDPIRIHETISKISVLKGLISLQTQHSSSDESSSENELMDL